MQRREVLNRLNCRSAYRSQLISDAHAVKSLELAKIGLPGLYICFFHPISAAYVHKDGFGIISYTQPANTELINVSICFRQIQMGTDFILSGLLLVRILCDIAIKDNSQIFDFFRGVYVLA